MVCLNISALIVLLASSLIFPESNNFFHTIDNKHSLRTNNVVLTNIKGEPALVQTSNKNNIKFLEPWIPVFSSFFGAIIGFIASFTVAYYLQNKKEKLAHIDFTKQKLENLYKTTISIRSEYSQLYSQALFHINKDEYKPGSISEWTVKNSQEIPPIVECEMLLNLYLPSLKVKFEQFTSIKKQFGTLWSQIMGTNYSNIIKKERQIVSEQITDLFFDICDCVEQFQYEISETAGRL